MWGQAFGPGQPFDPDHDVVPDADIHPNPEIAAAGCFTLFATHFGRLGELATVYPNARVWHLELDTGAAGERLTYTRRLRSGAAEDEHYGLLLAEAVGIPTEVGTQVTAARCNTSASSTMAAQ